MTKRGGENSGEVWVLTQFDSDSPISPAARRASLISTGSMFALSFFAYMNRGSTVPSS